MSVSNHASANAMRKICFLVMVVIFSTQDFSQGWADEEDHLRARELLQQGTILPLEEIVALATMRQPGHLLEAELKINQEKIVYEIEILDKDGFVWEFFFDAKSGIPLSSNRKD